MTEAGFSGTEVLVIKKLMEFEAMTLRELAAKTGKSTGVLDQAMKKLIKKKMVIRTMINNNPKYVLHSLEAVREWMKDDMKQKQQMIVRHYENFEAFIATVSSIKSKHRPEIDFFEGREGMKQAYMQLFERGRVFHQYGPTLWLPEEDPLQEFRVQFFRECHNRGIYTRVITHDTVLGRRYRTRDSFEYRETVLVSPSRHPFTFQKIIVGDTVACFNLEQESACFIRYNALAEEERAGFESMWYEGTHPEEFENCKGPVQNVVNDVPVKTKLFSTIRGFFLSYRGAIGLSTCLGIAGLLTAAFFWQMTNANLQKIREQVKSVAATGALQFSTADLDQLHTKADIAKPEYAKVIGQLNAIRKQNADLVYLFILRPTGEKGIYEYVADADSLNPDTVIDINKDGQIDEADANIIPGEKFAATDYELSNNLFSKPFANAKPYKDQYGTFIDGTAPIYDKTGKINSLLGVNKWAKDMYAGVDMQNISVFFVIIFFVFLLIWLMAVDRSLVKEVQKYMKEQENACAQLLRFFFTKRSIVVLVGLALISAVATFALYQNNASLNLKRIQEKVLSIAATGALQFDAKDLDELHTAFDTSKPAYAKSIYLLNAIRKQNVGVKYAYIMRPTEEEGIWEFVADADSLDPYAKKDLNGDEKIDIADHLSPPGEKFNINETNNFDYKKSLFQPMVSIGITQWGNLVTGWAPIKNASGSTVAILGIDKFTSDVDSLTGEKFRSIYSFIGLFLFFIVIRLAAFNRSLLREIYELAQLRRFILLVSGAALLSLIITFALYTYTQSLTLARMKDKVLAIAVTATSQFDADDIQALQTKDDWQKPEWQTIGSALQRIKKENPGVMYAYIIRKTKADPAKMEFAGDGDSINPFANTDNDPSNDVDMNSDGIIDGSPDGGDYQSWPGQPYPTAPAEAFDAYEGPITSKNYYEDQWGKVISGYAPVKDGNGNVIAVLAIDMGTDIQSNLTKEVFAPMYVFIVFFVLFILFRLKGFSASLLHQLLKPFRKRLTVLIILFCITLIAGAGVAVYHYTLQIMYQEIGTRLMSIAATAAPEFSAEDIQDIRIAADMKKDAYQTVFKKLNEIRKNNDKIQWAYIYRTTDVPGIWSFVADADSNYYVPFENTLDPNNDGVLDAADENVYPGMMYNMGFFSPDTLKTAFIGPTYSGQTAEDQWGNWLSGYAPIRDADGNTVAILGLDMDISEVNNVTWSRVSGGQ